MRGQVQILATAGTLCSLLLPVSGEDVCFNTTRPLSAAYGEGEGPCKSDRDCVNWDVQLDDDEDRRLKDQLDDVGETRYGYDLGLFCHNYFAKCHVKLLNGAQCNSSIQCQSRMCSSLSRHDAVKFCIGSDVIKPGMACESASDLCDGGVCWEEDSSPLQGAKTYRCRALGEVGDPCDIIWAGTGADATILRDSCSAKGADYPEFTNQLVYCRSRTPWRPNATYPSGTVADITSVGVCTEVAQIDENEMCDYLDGSQAHNSCGYQHYCKEYPFQGTMRRHCRKEIDEGEPCDEYDKERVAGGYISACEMTHMCNLQKTVAVAGDPRRGVCAKRFDLEPGAYVAEGAEELCEVEDDEEMQVYRDTTTSTCAKQPYKSSCIDDDDCVPDRGSLLIPTFCVKTFGSSGPGRCVSAVPPKCMKEWKTWRNWHTGDRYKETVALRIRDKLDRKFVRQLACCYADEIADHADGNACVGSQRNEAVRGVTGTFGAWASPSISVPRFMAAHEGSYVDLSGNAADLCSADGISVAVIVVVCLLGALLLGCLGLILYRECVMEPKPKKEKKKTREAEAAENTEPTRDVDAGVNEVTENPIPKRMSQPSQPDEEEIRQRQESAALLAEQLFSPRAGDAPLEAGAQVSVWYDGEHDGFHGWFNAIVVNYSVADETYDVMFDTKEVSCGVSKESVRPRI
eukprot:Rhum_TRINITY_DN21090_c0_g1::Rhum_TRINITY_DN21090_c0_g1_i1::g.173158::m.173158